MASFRLINNTPSVLPLSDSSFIAPGADRIVDQITLEMARLERERLLTIIQIADVSQDRDSPLLPDYVGTIDPNAGSNTGGGGTGGGTGGTGGSGNDLAALLPAPDGSIPEYLLVNNIWQATRAPRQLLLDGGNF